MAVDRFELMRQRIKQQTTADQQSQEEAMRKRFAAAGGLSSGASMRAQSQVQEAGARRAAEGMQGVDIAQAQEQFQTEEQQKQREFAKAERLGSQEFAQGERLASQAFGAGENKLSRDFQESMFNKDYAFKKDQFEQAKSQFAAQLDWENQKFQYEKTVDDFNRGMAQRIQQFNEQPGLIDKLMAPMERYQQSAPAKWLRKITGGFV